MTEQEAVAVFGIDISCNESVLEGYPIPDPLYARQPHSAIPVGATE